MPIVQKRAFISTQEYVGSILYECKTDLVSDMNSSGNDSFIEQ